MNRPHSLASQRTGLSPSPQAELERKRQVLAQNQQWVLQLRRLLSDLKARLSQEAALSKDSEGVALAQGRELLSLRKEGERLERDMELLRNRVGAGSQLVDFDVHFSDLKQRSVKFAERLQALLRESQLQRREALEESRRLIVLNPVSIQSDKQSKESSSRLLLMEQTEEEGLKST
jgi:hypothetical protein